MFEFYDEVTYDIQNIVISLLRYIWTFRKNKYLYYDIELKQGRRELTEEVTSTTRCYLKGVKLKHLDVVVQSIYHIKYEFSILKEVNFEKRGCWLDNW